MPTVAKTYTFSSGEIVQASEHNTNLNTLYTLVNGSLDNTNIASNAGIAESKITFSASGHDHTGGSKGANVSISSLTITNQSLGDLLYFNGTAWARLGTGTAGQTLTMSGGLPTWA